MKLLFQLSITLLLIIPVSVKAQKAYNAVAYIANVKGKSVKLILADGYLAASKITISKGKMQKTIVFLPESGVPDEGGKLKFIQASLPSEYFIADGLKESFENLPVIIKASYHTQGRVISVQFKKREH
ncbi:hypothetical protein GCM10023149_10780 [Mucilaginibacter gynuensis]|uniref:Uncharacterized protein n=1 Tax=Mucilaginibacter gynuensis TaxID=1302236 RepID=A0ABP8G044_9SPHI